MRRHLRILLPLFAILLVSCVSRTKPPAQTSLYVYRPNPPAFIEFSNDLQVVREIPFSIPPSCGLVNVFPSPIGQLMLIELSCPNGQTVLFLNTETVSVTQPVTDADSHFLAWTEYGRSVALRVDSLGDPRIVRLNVDTLQTEVISIPGLTYDLAAQPYTYQFSFTTSGGLGHGSEMFLAKHDGQIVQSLYADPYHYLSFASWSPKATQIAFIKIPDNQTPFTVGELWVMGEDGSNPRKLADADAGHGYAANWSPDGKRIAFVVRENPEEQRADQSSEALLSNIYLVEVESGALTPVTHLEQGRVETPFWSPDGNTLAFHAVINDRMEVRIADLATGEIRTLITESTCCPAWMRK
jgi:Tol biopolymer transport system component